MEGALYSSTDLLRKLLGSRRRPRAKRATYVVFVFLGKGCTESRWRAWVGNDTTSVVSHLLGPVDVEVFGYRAMRVGNGP